MSREKFVEDSTKDFGLKDDKIYNLIKTLTSGKITPVRRNSALMSFPS